MKTIKLLAASLLVALSVGFSSCGDYVTNEIIQQEPDNTLDLLIGTWKGTGEAEGETFTFNKDNTYSEQDYNYNHSGTFEYLVNRYMFVLYYTVEYSEPNSSETTTSQENRIYTVVKVTDDTLVLNDNGHSDVITYKRKK